MVSSCASRYGGSIAIGGGSITVGSLIKYQLYWNMVNNSWQVRVLMVAVGAVVG